MTAELNQPDASLLLGALRRRDASAARIWDQDVYPLTRLVKIGAAFDQAKQDFDPRTKTWAKPFVFAAAPSITPGLLVKLMDRWARIPNDDDRTSTPTAWGRALEVTAQTKADRQFLTDAKNETGDAAGPKHGKQARERAQLLAQSHQLAQRLEAAGTPAYRKDGAGLWVYWVCSQKAELLPQFRRICFLPSVAASIRAGKLAALEFFLARNPFCRFWTFTSGPRVKLDDLRARVVWLHAKLNELNQWLRTTWQVELIFRSTEMGTLEFNADGQGAAAETQGRIEFDPSGAPLFHPHAHCVVQSLRGFIPPKEWARMFAEIWDRWTDDEGNQLNWDGGRKGQPGTIRNARECCKYITKPGDLLKLSGPQLAETERQLHGLHLVQPLGSLKTEIAARRKAGKVLVRVPTPDGSVWTERVDWNKWAEESDEEKAFSDNQREARTCAKETAAAARVTPGTPPRGVDETRPWTRIFARLRPAIGPSGVKEARVVVGGTHLDLATVKLHPLVARLWGETVENFELGLAAERRAVHDAPWREAALIRVHTGTLTATDDSPFAGPEPDESWETASPVEMLADFAAR